ncbi:MAG TPA: TonB-dependent receptor, partial [Chitinophagales bacterium]|nr:TonB-dependent receptor [Chitinophagales bacterium]
MIKSIALLLNFLLPLGMFAQTQLSGIVTDQKGVPIIGANIYIRDTYDGTSTDAAGKFIFSTIESDSQTLVISYIGFESFEQSLFLKGGSQDLKIVLKEIVNELNTVVITAGSFEASDERRITILRPLDIVTTAGAAGDIYGALQTLPGTQQIGDETGLFVRGGDASETKTFIDGIAVADPYFTGVPDIPSRGRFSPFLFKGTFFSTGGYSAQYGDAMSSALVLESQDLPAQSTTNIGLMSVGASIGHSHRWKNTSLGAYVSYINLLPYITIVTQRVDWTKAPESFNGSLIFRHKTSKTGLLKAFISFAPSNSIINYPNINDTSATSIPYNIHNQNLFANASYKELIGKNWTFFSGISYSSNNDDIIIGNEDSIRNKNTLAQGRITLSHPVGNLSTIRFGGELQHPEYTDAFNNLNFHYNANQKNNYAAAYAEADIYVTQKLVARLG